MQSSLLLDSYCLNENYSFNSCTLCITQCEQNALVFNDSSLNLIEEKCTLCAECIGICPTENISLDTFDINSFVSDFCENDSNTICDKKSLPSLAMLDSYHLISIVLRKRENIFLEHTNSISNKAFEFIEDSIEKANYLLHSMGNQNSIFIKTVEDKYPTIEALRTKNLEKENSNTPYKLSFMNDSLKIGCEDFNSTVLTIDNKETFFNKTICNDSCENCQDCVNNCPTNALYTNEAKNEIHFISGKCIGCNNCINNCSKDAISSVDSIDLIEFAFNQSRLEVSFSRN